MHFFLADLIGTLAAIPLLAPFLLTPGYAAGWLLDLRGFRSESWIWRVLWALPLSAGITPIVCFLAGAAFGFSAIYGLFSAATLFFFWKLGRPQPGIPRWLGTSAALWLVVTVFSCVDLQWGGRLYPSVLIYDHNLRAALVDGISRNGIPAINGLFHPGQDVPLRYHYLWFIPAAAVERLAQDWITARHAIAAVSVWTGWNVIALALLFLRYICNRPAFGPAGLWTIVVLCASGLDIIPAGLMALAYWTSGAGAVLPSIEWWNNPVTGIPGAVLFVSHHLTAMLVCITGFLVLWRQKSWKAAIAAALCFASAPGLSIFVALAFAATAAVWFFHRLWRRDLQALLAWSLAGAGAFALAWPYLRTLAGASSSGGSLLVFTVREFVPIKGLLAAFDAESNQLAASFANLLALPLNYLFESGICVTAAVLLWRRRKREAGVVVLAAVPIVLASFLRSGLINNNDFGWRSLLIAQFALLVWAAPVLRSSYRRNRWVKALLLFGLAGAAWDLLAIRFYLPLAEAGLAQAPWWYPAKDIGRFGYDMRTLYEEVAKRTAPGDVVQGNPDVWDQVFLGAYSGRQAGSFDHLCGAQMGGDPALCQAMNRALIPVFRDPGADPTAACRDYRLSVLVVDSRDAVWASAATWMKDRKPIVERPHARAYSCAPAQGGSPAPGPAALKFTPGTPDE